MYFAGSLDVGKFIVGKFIVRFRKIVWQKIDLGMSQLLICFTCSYHTNSAMKRLPGVGVTNWRPSTSGGCTSSLQRSFSRFPCTHLTFYYFKQPSLWPTLYLASILSVLYMINVWSNEGVRDTTSWPRSDLDFRSPLDHLCLIPWNLSLAYKRQCFSNIYKTTTQIHTFVKIIFTIIIFFSFNREFSVDLSKSLCTYYKFFYAIFL